MKRTMCAAKIHRAVVTDACLDYVGSLTVDRGLLALSGIVEYEQVHVVNINNGARMVTYAIEGGPGEICLNGAAARLGAPGDLVIIMAFREYRDDELAAFRPRVVQVDRRNRPDTIPQTSAAATDD